MNHNKSVEALALFALGAANLLYFAMVAFVYVAVAGPENLASNLLASALALTVPVAILLIPITFIVAKILGVTNRKELFDQALAQAEKDRQPETMSSEKFMRLMRRMMTWVFAGILVFIAALPLLYAITLGLLGRLLNIHWSLAVGAVIVIVLLCTFGILKRKYGSFMGVFKRFLDTDQPDHRQFQH
jgi:uncharacterized membrane protein (DUF485 family)